MVVYSTFCGCSGSTPLPNFSSTPLRCLKCHGRGTDSWPAASSRTPSVQGACLAVAVMRRARLANGAGTRCPRSWRTLAIVAIGPTLHGSRSRWDSPRHPQPSPGFDTPGSRAGGSAEHVVRFTPRPLSDSSRVKRLAGCRTASSVHRPERASQHPSGRDRRADCATAAGFAHSDSALPMFVVALNEERSATVSRVGSSIQMECPAFGIVSRVALGRCAASLGHIVGPRST